MKYLIGFILVIFKIVFSWLKILLLLFVLNVKKKKIILVEKLISSIILIFL